jgi:hypothetical protein
MRDFEDGVTLGQMMSRQDSHELRISSVEKEIADLRTMGQRAALVAMLWAGGMLLNLPADRIGETAGAFLKALR